MKLKPRSIRRLAQVLLLVWVAVLSSTALAGPEDTLHRARYDLAQRLLAGKQLGEARAIARTLVAEDPKFLLAWILLGVTYGTNEATYDLAEEAFDAAHELDKTHPEPLSRLGSLQFTRGDIDKAANTFVLAASLAEDDATLQIMTARVLLKAQRIEEAKQRFLTVLDADPLNLEALTGVGALYVNIGEYSAAADLYKKAFDAGLDNPILYLNFTDTLVRAARYDEALAIAEKGLAKKQDPQLKVAKARALVHLERYAEAEELLAAVAPLTSTDETAAYPIYLLGLARSMQGCKASDADACTKSPDAHPCCAEDRASLVAFQRSYELNPELRDVVIRLGLAQFAAGQLEEAEATLQGYINKQGDQSPAEAFGALAVTLYGFGEKRDVDEGVRLYREAREMAPDFDKDDRLKKFRQWPPLAIEIITELKQKAEEQRPTGGVERKGCGCQLGARPASGFSWAWAMGFGAVLLGFAMRRRHA